MDKPEYEHDCDTCRFLRNVVTRDTVGMKVADAYMCNNTLLLRFSDRPDDYESLDIQDMIYAAVNYVYEQQGRPLYNLLSSLINNGDIKIIIKDSERKHL